MDWLEDVLTGRNPFTGEPFGITVEAIWQYIIGAGLLLAAFKYGGEILSWLTGGATASVGSALSGIPIIGGLFHPAAAAPASHGSASARDAYV